MSRAGTLTRRALLISGVAVTGGVAFGVYKLRTPPENPLTALAGDGVSFNPYVLITTDRITLIAPHVDLGQGAASLQAALIAEEMDLAFGQFDIAPGPPAAAYFNTALGDEAVPFLSTDTGRMAEALRGAAGAAFKLAGLQITGGSSTTPDSFDKLRLAGAVARETLKAAASAQTGIPAAQLSTAAGAVQLPDGTAIDYRALAQAAARIDPVQDVTLRAPDTWRLIGKPMQRLDVVAKSTGQQAYGIDLRLDDMLLASLRCNPRKGACLRSFDASAALSMGGVQHVLPVTGGVAVVADNTWYALQALEAIEYDWEAASYPAEQDAHWSAVSAAFAPQYLDRIWRDDGAPLAEADPLQTWEYRAPYVAHQPLEPLNAVARVTDESADVWSSHQMPRFVQERVARITGLDPDQVIFHNQFAGGSFGHRLEFDVVDRAVEIALQLKGRPIKLTYAREEDFAQDYPRQIGMARARGTVAAGHVTGLDLQIATPSVTRSQMSRVGLPAPGPDLQIAAGAWNMPYAIANLRVRGYAVPELAPISSWRAVGASTAGFFAESALDELIHAAGADPMVERLRLVNDPVARAVLEAVAEMSDWGKAVEPGQGRGVALVSSFGVPVAEVIDVTATTEGIRIDRVFVAADVGLVVDPVNFENQVQGGVIWGLGHAINSEVTYRDGMIEQINYHDAEGMRLYQTPEISVRALQSALIIRGIGEPPVPPAAPALANAVFAATGVRLREMPFFKFMDFV